jgi:hypothetical protein
VGFLVRAKALEEKKIPKNPASYLDLHKPGKPALGWNMLHTISTYS